ncbi:hypothetical protein [Pseudomonas chlororaphis]|uniref:hypothetical protein n=1 Tax=Pseudomonas chlororaphis TaxID=587753 RepID=UPI0039E00D99
MRPASLDQELDANVDSQQGVAARNTSAGSNTCVDRLQVIRPASLGQELSTDIDSRQGVAARNT